MSRLTIGVEYNHAIRRSFIVASETEVEDLVKELATIDNAGPPTQIVLRLLYCIAGQVCLNPASIEECELARHAHVRTMLHLEEITEADAQLFDRVLRAIAWYLLYGDLAPSVFKHFQQSHFQGQVVPLL